MEMIALYNPANATNLTAEQVEAMRALTTDQIGELAKAYPNKPTGNAYLVYYVKNEPVNKQRYPLGTWQNLYNLRKLGKNNYIPYNFKATFVNTPAIAQKANTVAAGVSKKRVVDLNAGEKIEGLKTGTDQTLPLEERLKLVNDFNSVDIPETTTIQEAAQMANDITKEIDELPDTAENLPLRQTMILSVEKVNSFINAKSNSQGSADSLVDETNPLVIEYRAARKELDDAVEKKAHHATIKSLEKKAAEAKTAAGL